METNDEKNQLNINQESVEDLATELPVVPVKTDPSESQLENKSLKEFTPGTKIKNDYDFYLNGFGVKVDWFINLAMVIVSLLLYKEALNSSKDASESAISAKRSASAAQKIAQVSEDVSLAAKKSNDISYINYKLALRSFDSTIKSDALNRENYRKTIQIQLEQLQTAKKQFELINQPLLSINSASISKFIVNQPITMNFEILNLGNYTCKVMEVKTVTAIRIVPPSFDEVNIGTQNSNDLLNRYIKNAPLFTGQFELPRPLREDEFNAVTKGNYYVFFSGFIKYKNIIDLTERIYRFQIKMKPNEDPYYLINENQ